MDGSLEIDTNKQTMMNYSFLSLPPFFLLLLLAAACSIILTSNTTHITTTCNLFWMDDDGELSNAM